MALACLAFLACVPAPASASLVSIFSSGACGSASGPTSATLTATCGDTLGTSTTTVDVNALGSLDVLKIYTAHTATIDANTSVINGPSAGAGIVVSDQVLVTGGTGAGVMTLAWDIDGTLDATGAFSSALILESVLAPSYLLKEWRYCGPSSPAVVCVADHGVHETVSLDVAFVFGAPLALNWTLRTSIGTSSMAPSTSASGVVDFFNTATLKPIVVRDSTGQQVEADVVSDSQYRYAVANRPDVVPEPTLLGLLCCGIGAALARRRTTL